MEWEEDQDEKKRIGQMKPMLDVTGEYSQEETASLSTFGSQRDHSSYIKKKKVTCSAKSGST